MKKYLRIIIYLFIIMFVVMELVFFVRDLLSTNGPKNMADWFSAIGTVAAVIVALFQMLQSKKDRKPIILFTMKHHGLYDKQDNNFYRNRLAIKNYGKSEAIELDINLKVSNNVENWIESKDLYIEKQKYLKISKDLKSNKKYKVKFQDILAASERKYIWFPQEYLELFVLIIKEMNKNINSWEKAVNNTEVDINEGFPIFYYTIKYKYDGKSLSGKDTVEIKPKFEVYNVNDKLQRKIRLSFYITNEWK